MKKFTLILSFIIMLGGIVSFPSNMHAADDIGTYAMVDICAYSQSASINSQGVVEFEATIVRGNNVDRVTANHQLQRYISGRWVTIHVWSYSSTEQYNDYAKTGNFDSSSDYQVVSTVKSYDGDTVTETLYKTTEVTHIN